MCNSYIVRYRCNHGGDRRIFAYCHLISQADKNANYHGEKDFDCLETNYTNDERKVNYCCAITCCELLLHPYYLAWAKERKAQRGRTGETNRLKNLAIHWRDGHIRDCRRGAPSLINLRYNALRFAGLHEGAIPGGLRGDAFGMSW